MMDVHRDDIFACDVIGETTRREKEGRQRRGRKS